MRLILFVFAALLYVPGTVEAAQEKKKHPGPQPSVTIRKLPPPALKAQPSALAVDGMRARKLVDRKMRARIKAMRNYFIELKKRTGKVKTDREKEYLQRRVEEIKRMILRERRRLKELKRRPFTRSR